MNTNDDSKLLGEEYTVAIEVTFPVPVHISRDLQQRLDALISEICDIYEAQHPDRIMWPAGFGGKITSMANGVPLDFDMSVLAINCAERERYETERPPRRGRTALRSRSGADT